MKEYLTRRYYDRIVMSVSDILKELLIDETEPSAILIRKDFELQDAITPSRAIEYIVSHL